MRFLLSFVVLSLAIACGPKAPSSPVPVLPGDGDRNTAKPVQPAKPSVADPWAGRTDLITAPAPKPPGPVELPNIEQFKLANGLQVHIVKSDRLPVASLQLAIKAGRMHEPRSRLGVAEFTAHMLVKGTKRRDANALAKKIDFVGGTIGADATFEATLLSCSVLAKNLPTCLELLPEMITMPSFPDTELAKSPPSSARISSPGTSSGSSPPTRSSSSRVMSIRRSSRRSSRRRSVAGSKARSRPRPRSRNPGSPAAASASSTSRARRRRTSASRSTASSTTTRASSTRSSGTTSSVAAASRRAS